MNFDRVVSLCSVGIIMATSPLAMAQQRSASTSTSTTVTAAAASNSGPTQTLIVNTSSNPVPITGKVDLAPNATVNIAGGALTLASDDSKPLVVRESHGTQNRLSLVLWWPEGGQRELYSVDAFGGLTPFSQMPAGKVFVVTDASLSATGSTGDQRQVSVGHSTSHLSEFGTVVTVTAFGSGNQKMQFTAAPIFGDLPEVDTMGTSGGERDFTSLVWLRGFLADAPQ